MRSILRGDLLALTPQDQNGFPNKLCRDTSRFLQTATLARQIAQFLPLTTFLAGLVSRRQETAASPN